MTCTCTYLFLSSRNEKWWGYTCFYLFVHSCSTMVLKSTSTSSQVYMYWLQVRVYLPCPLCNPIVVTLENYTRSSDGLVDSPFCFASNVWSWQRHRSTPQKLLGRRLFCHTCLGTWTHGGLWINWCDGVRNCKEKKKNNNNNNNKERPEGGNRKKRRWWWHEVSL